MQIGVPPIALPDGLGPQLVPDVPANPSSLSQIKVTATQQ